MEVIPGLMRVDVGEPIARVHGAPQPVPHGGPTDAPAGPVEVQRYPIPQTPNRPHAAPRDWRRDYGLANSR